ncbi:MAG TPA: hypothetical protein VFH15_09920 [Pyrinomonadaceae bacterium]|nr:hypothetical protein [Pyrinomonadaceae bacterium]
MNPARKSIVSSAAAMVAVPDSSSDRVAAERLRTDTRKRKALEKKRDNPHSDRFIEVGTKALRRETDVWGDAAGTAPAVTSVTSLSPSIYY